MFDCESSLLVVNSDRITRFLVHLDELEPVSSPTNCKDTIDVQARPVRLERGQASSALLAGVRDIAPILVGVVPFALLYGVAAREAGLSAGAAIAMSLVVFAGASQLAMVNFCQVLVCLNEFVYVE